MTNMRTMEMQNAAADFAIERRKGATASYMQGDGPMISAFIAGARWQLAHDDTAHMAKVLESREPHKPGGIIWVDGTTDDAWRATLQATINQQAEEIERLREAERRLITMVKVGTGAA